MDLFTRLVEYPELLTEVKLLIVSGSEYSSVVVAALIEASASEVLQADISDILVAMNPKLREARAALERNGPGGSKLQSKKVCIILF